MPLSKRILIYASLWVLAGVVTAILLRVTLGPDEGSNFTEQLKIVFYAPLLSALGVAFALLPNRCDSSLYYLLVGFLLLVYVVHAIITLTRQSRREFLICSAIQAVYLAISVVCVLCLFHWMTHMFDQSDLIER